MRGWVKVMSLPIITGREEKLIRALSNAVSISGIRR